MLKAGKKWMISMKLDSSIRSIDLSTKSTSTIAGADSNIPQDLFLFGDVEGCGNQARLQHPLKTCHLENRLFLVAGILGIHSS